MTRWWQAPNVVPLAAILAFSVIVGSQGRRITALEGRAIDLDRQLQNQQQVLAPIFDDYVSRLPGQRHVEPQDCGPCWNGWDPASQKFVRVCRRDSAHAP